ncbi:MAG: hypothetical protein J0I34_31880 [Pseudonocardia sp.]|nr:hypothetical protein [Pseudonocardia sp.]ODU23275.1 MAG: hypothetical protein ABS80_15390 [Pseudonocardia sp. SCN 72-51]ODV03750.1 MAG: hypothetical protein ABT15_22240 [Pseudonocardia sp. SCN 73-27]
MSSVGVLILFAIVGAVICAKCRVPAGAVMFSLVALVLFIATPAGQGLLEAVSSFLSTVDDPTTPALTHQAPAGSEAAS